MGKTEKIAELIKYVDYLTTKPEDADVDSRFDKILSLLRKYKGRSIYIHYDRWYEKASTKYVNDIDASYFALITSLNAWHDWPCYLKKLYISYKGELTFDIIELMQCNAKVSKIRNNNRSVKDIDELLDEKDSNSKFLDNVIEYLENYR